MKYGCEHWGGILKNQFIVVLHRPTVELPPWLIRHSNFGAIVLVRGTQTYSRHRRRRFPRVTSQQVASVPGA